MIRLPFYYGWVVLAALAATEMMAMGATLYSAGLYVLPLQHEFGLSRAASSSSISILLIGTSIVAPIIGKALDTYSVRWVLCLGALAMSAAFAVIALSSSLWLMIPMLILPAAIGFAALGTLPTGTLLSRWFRKRRGLALGLGAVATSGGGIWVAPWLSALIQAYGWRQTLLIEAAIIGLVSIFLAVFVVRNTPADMGLENHPENVEDGPQKKAEVSGPQWHWKAILSDRTFWGTAILLAIVSGISQALVTSLPPYAVELGFSAAAAASLISYFSWAAGVTKILGGLLADYTNRRLLMFCAGLIMVAAAVILFVSSGYAALAAAATLAGMALGCALPSSSALIASTFGAKSFGTIMGWVYVVLCLSATILPPLTGRIFDVTHSYNAAFIFFGMLSALGAASTALIRRDSR